MTFPSGLRALDHPDFRLFFAAQFVALVGSWMQQVGQAWLVLQLTGSPFRLGLIGTLQFAPILLFSLVSGAIADRLPKRRLLIATQATLAAQALGLAVLVGFGHVQYWHVAVLAVVTGLANVLDMPARQSFVVEMVSRNDVVNAVALNSAAFNAARIVGPAVAGLLIGRFGVAPTFVLNALGFVVVIGALLGLRARGLPRPRQGTTIREEIAEGVRYALRTPWLVLMLGLLFVVTLPVFNFTVYVPLLARDVLGLGAEGFGFLMASLGVGAVAGALTIGMLGPRPLPLWGMFGAAAAACLGLFGLGFVRQVGVAVPVLLVTGYFGILLVASCNTGMQLTAPDELRGRVMSLYVLVWGGVFPIGAFCVGSVSEAWGVSIAFRIAGVLGLVSVAGLGLWWRLRAASSDILDKSDRQ